MHVQSPYDHTSTGTFQTTTAKNSRTHIEVVPITTPSKHDKNTPDEDGYDCNNTPPSTSMTSCENNMTQHANSNNAVSKENTTAITTTSNIAIPDTTKNIATTPYSPYDQNHSTDNGHETDTTEFPKKRNHLIKENKDADEYTFNDTADIQYKKDENENISTAYSTNNDKNL